MKVALIGGGGFRAPIVWASVAGLGAGRVEELSLYDVDEVRLRRVADVIEGLRRERGDGPSVTTTTDLDAGLEGAQIVFCAIRVGGLAGRIVDETVPLKEGVLGQETVGPGGISFALRTVPVMLDIAAKVSRRAPGSWFLNFTNPAGLVTEAVQSVLGDRAIGICDSPTALCARVAAALGRSPEELIFDYAGLNHLGWLLAVEQDGHNLLPDLLADDMRLFRVEEAHLFGPQRLRTIRAIPNEYLSYYDSPAEIVMAMRKAGSTRAQALKVEEDRFYEGTGSGPEQSLAEWRRVRDLRFGTYMAEVHAVADIKIGTVDRAAVAPGEDGLLTERDSMVEANGADGGPERVEVQGPGEAGYAAIAAAFLEAVGEDRDADLILNVANQGRLPSLDDNAVVEVSCRVSSDGPHLLAGLALPSELADLVARVKEVERTTIRAAVTGSRTLALEALAAHPVMPSRPTAERILDRYLAKLPALAERLR
jgi:6-phospho-beta-glucosidase